MIRRFIQNAKKLHANKLSHEPRRRAHGRAGMDAGRRPRLAGGRTQNRGSIFYMEQDLALTHLYRIAHRHHIYLAPIVIHSSMRDSPPAI